MLYVGARRSLLKRRGNSAPIWTPAANFPLGTEPGLWYDPSSFAGLYQDSAGTSPATAVGQPVGLMLDKRLGLVLGPEVITAAANRDLSADTGFWAKSSGITIAGGVCTFAAAADGNSLSRNDAPLFTVGHYYEVTFNVVSRVAGGFRVYLGGPIGNTYTAPGTYTQRFMCEGNNYFGVIAVGTTTGEIDNISIKRVSGNHISQATASARPIINNT